ncbi:hypothetical protein KY285_023309 [Solanum tuberosum]|nr:hypothetical protein KY285_023309 [Solanum tuberosum]
MTQGVTGEQTTGNNNVDGSSGNPSFIPAMSMSQGVDYNHPLFLSPADISGVNLISFQLIGIENYALWSRSIKLELLGRNKIGLVDGSCKQERILLGGVVVASSAQGVWNDLKERFDQLDGSRTFGQHKEITTLQQGTDSVSAYFTKLKTL